MNPFKEHKLVIIGSEGMIVFEDSSSNKDILFYDKYYDYQMDNSINVIKEKPKITIEKPRKEDVSKLIIKIN